MAILENGGPTAAEIEDQLDRMLSAKRFGVAEKQSEFLALVVKRALKEKKTAGHIVAKELFPDKVCKTPDGKIQIVGNDVRSNALHLRKTLRNYYAEEGREDPVVISLPQPPKDRTVKMAEGEAYTPQFAYSPMQSVVKALKLGDYFHRRGELEDEEIAFQHFAKALYLAPHHVEAAIGVIESWCALVDWDMEIDKEVEKHEWLMKAYDLMCVSMNSGSKYWRIYAAMGCLHRKGRREDERGCFEKARMLDRACTESYWPYIQFLQRVGQNEEALSLTKRHLERHEDDIRAYVRYGTALLISKQYPEAEEIFERALGIDKSNTFVRYYVAQLRIWRLRREDALPHQAILKALLDDRSYALTDRLIAKYSEIVEDHIRSNNLMDSQSEDLD